MMKFEMATFCGSMREPFCRLFYVTPRSKITPFRFMPIQCSHHRDNSGFCRTTAGGDTIADPGAKSLYEKPFLVHNAGHCGLISSCRHASNGQHAIIEP